MSDIALVALLVFTALTCPAMMWWQRRQGRSAACCLPRRTPPDLDSRADLLRRQDDLAAQIAALEGRPDETPATALARDTRESEQAESEQARRG